MIIFPAIDLRNGQCVRLLYGQPDKQTVYASDPVGVAEQFVHDGASWLHIVNLDGAFSDETGAGKNQRALQRILEVIGIPVQVGGGIRREADIERLLNLGVARVILGTLAAREPKRVGQIIRHFGPDRIVVGIDAREGQVAVNGWQTTSTRNALEFGQEMAAEGVLRIVHTDISRDGALTGSNVAASAELASATKVNVIISGGVADLADIHRAKAAANPYLEGMIIGRALYEGKLSLVDAVAAAGRPIARPY